jgi:hypothetical protein
MKNPLLSRGNLTELTPWHFVPDGRDTYPCDNCGHVSTDDRNVVDHPVKPRCVLCIECGKNWLNDNQLSPAESPQALTECAPGLKGTAQRGLILKTS